MSVSTVPNRWKRNQEIALTAGEWECISCGYVQAGLVHRVPRKCPLCGAKADMFAFFDHVEDHFLPKGGLAMDERLTAPVEGEWECDNCGYIEVGVSTEPPKGNCPECGKPAKSTFVFYAYDDTDDEDWDDDWSDEWDDEWDEEEEE